MRKRRANLSLSFCVWSVCVECGGVWRVSVCGVCLCVEAFIATLLLDPSTTALDVTWKNSLVIVSQCHVHTLRHQCHVRTIRRSVMFTLSVEVSRSHSRHSVTFAFPVTVSHYTMRILEQFLKVFYYTTYSFYC